MAGSGGWEDEGAWGDPIGLIGIGMLIVLVPFWGPFWLLGRTAKAVRDWLRAAA